MDEERLAKLNAYLISKGKRPKQIKKDFVKSNIKNVNKLPLNNSNFLNGNKDPDHASIKKNDVYLKKNKLCEKENVKKTTQSKCDQLKTAKNMTNKNMEPKNGPKKCQSKTLNKNFRKSLRKSAAFNLSHLQKKNGSNISVKQCATPKTAEKLRKKLIRRSVIASLQKTRKEALDKNENCGIKPACNMMTPNKNILTNYGGSKSVQPTSRFQSRVAEKRSKTISKRKSLSLSQQQNDRMEKLKSWMKSKGKNPNHLRGFKPVKSFLTPTNSPSTNTSFAHGGSFWPTLRGEDYFDELSILVKNSMQEARACLDQGCSAQEVFDLLKDFKERVSVAEEHAAYWVTYAQVHEIFGNTEDEMIEIYENAIKKQAKPISILKEELKNFLERVANNERLTQKTEPEIIPSNDKIPPEHGANTSLKHLPQPELDQTDDSLEFQPVLNFKTPNKKQIADLSSPSSVIKLRMIPKSSPLFKQLAARKALSANVAAIITPVRRSRRIENSTTKYPKVVQGHDPCVTTPRELMKNQPGKTPGNFLFDSNDALGQEFNDLSKLLHL